MILLDEYLKKIKFVYPNHEVFVTGDLNARTQDKVDYIVNECVDYLPCKDWYTCDSFDRPRWLKDVHGDINLHGKALLQLCCTLDIHIANGRCPSDKKENLHVMQIEVKVWLITLYCQHSFFILWKISKY